MFLHFRLPCFVDSLAGFIILWKWDTENSVIAVGDQIVDKSFRLETSKNGNTLVIQNAGLEHEGQYTCGISYYTPTEIVHTLKMRGKSIKFYKIIKTNFSLLSTRATLK